MLIKKIAQFKDAIIAAVITGAKAMIDNLRKLLQNVVRFLIRKKRRNSYVSKAAKHKAKRV